MYLHHLEIQNFRVFREAQATFQYPGRVPTAGEQAPEHPNLNLILGSNGAGKSTLLKAVALACLGPLAAKFPPYRLVRLPSPKPAKGKRGDTPTDVQATLRAQLRCTWQDMGERKPSPTSEELHWALAVRRNGDEESIEALNASSQAASARAQTLWAPVHQAASPAFLAVGYGATRRVEADPGGARAAQRLRSLPLRHQRIQSLFAEAYPLVPFGHWLPQLKTKNPGRFKQVCHRINEVLPDEIEFTEQVDAAGEYLFHQRGAKVPFAALSDGCRGFIGWVADLLYHICFGCPAGVKLVDNSGIVLVDEIDLHLHPEWQRTVLPRLARAFPRLQFIVTTHSPIVVGTLQRENLWVCEPAPDGDGVLLLQKQTGVHGLNSDQILLTEYFRLASSRAPRKEAQLDRIAAAAERQVPGQALAFLRSLSTPLEDSRD